MKLEEKNAAKARTHIKDASGSYYLLDNAASIMPSIASQSATFLFRIGVTLDGPVELPALETALRETARRFPYFRVELKSGFFWYYFDPSDLYPPIELDPESPCMGFATKRKGQLLYRIRVRGSRLACEFSHVLTDGTGGLAFLKTLLARYFRELGIDPGDDPDALKLDEEPDPEEHEDAYHRFFKGRYPHPEPGKSVFHAEGPLLPPDSYRVTSGETDIAAALALSKKYGVSLTELMAATLMYALQEHWFSLPQNDRRRRRHRVAIEIPVNMRNVYPTKTLRNFSLFVLPSIDMLLGRLEYDEIIATVHHQMRIENKERMIAKQIARNAGGTRNIVVRLIPLVVKNVMFKLLFSAMGENMLSSFISNLGIIKMPPETAGKVRRFDFIPAPSPVMRVNAAMASYRDSLVVSFGSLNRGTEIERLFFSKLAEEGLKIKVDSNLEV